jgi:hypothetical protein
MTVDAIYIMYAKKNEVSSSQVEISLVASTPPPSSRGQELTLTFSTISGIPNSPVIKITPGTFKDARTMLHAFWPVCAQ